MHRLFVALRPPPVVREALLALQDDTPGARWQDDDQLHLTLAFIGEVEGPIAEDVAAALGGVGGSRITVEIRGVGFFERRGVPHTLWAGVRTDTPLTALHRRVHRAIEQVGVRLEVRSFAPHITLARLGRGTGPLQPFIQRYGGLTMPAFELDAFLLYESRLGREGASYEAIARYPLG